jgi:hypothetical protein
VSARVGTHVERKESPGACLGCMGGLPPRALGALVALLSFPPPANAQPRRAERHVSNVPPVCLRPTPLSGW